MKKLLLPLLLLIIWTSQYAEKKDEIPLRNKYSKDYFFLKDLSFSLTGYVEDNRIKDENFDFFAIKDILMPMYIAPLFHREVDLFGFPFRFRVINYEVWIASVGSDGVFKGWDQTGSYKFKSASGQDIIFKNGKAIFPDKNPFDD